jgi:hypothetical protein
MDIEGKTCRRADLPRPLEQQVLDFGQIVWFDGDTREDPFRERMHEVSDDTTHFVGALAKAGPGGGPDASKSPHPLNQRRLVHVEPARQVSPYQGD